MRESRCTAAVISGQRHLCSMRQHRCSSHFEWTFLLQIWLIASFVTVVDNSGSHKQEDYFFLVGLGKCGTFEHSDIVIARPRSNDPVQLVSEEQRPAN